MDDFPPLFLLWYQLVTHKPSHVSELVDAQLLAVRHLRDKLAKQNWPVRFVFGGGASAHNPHLLFFQLQSTGPNRPLLLFNLDRNVLNKYIWSRISARTRPEQMALMSTIYQSQFGFLFHPLSNGPSGVTPTAAANLTPAVLDQLVADIGLELTLLDRAGSLREEFKTAVSAQKELQYVSPQQIEHAFVGVGAFRLVPAFPIPVQQANALNVVLAHALAKQNPQLFAIAMTTGNNAAAAAVAAGAAGGAQAGTPTSAAAATAAAPNPNEQLVCTVVRTSSLVMDKHCVTILISEILDAAARLELPKEVVDQLSKVVQKGIREAEAKLAQETSDAYYPTTLIRKLPVVGSVWNWFSPVPVKTEAEQKQPAGYSMDIRSQELISKPKVSVTKTDAKSPPAAASSNGTPTSAAAGGAAPTPTAAAAMGSPVPAPHGLLGAAPTPTAAAASATEVVPPTPVKPNATPAVAGTTATAPGPAPAAAAPAPTPAPAPTAAPTPTAGAAATGGASAPSTPAKPTGAAPPQSHTHTQAAAPSRFELIAPDKLITDIFTAVAAQFYAKLKLPQDRAIHIVAYAKQLVAGINFFVIVQIDQNEFVHARIFSSFRTAGAGATGAAHPPPELVGIKPAKRDDPLLYF